MNKNGRSEKFLNFLVRKVYVFTHIRLLHIFALFRFRPFFFGPLGPLFCSKMKNAVLYCILQYTRRLACSECCSNAVFLQSFGFSTFRPLGPFFGEICTGAPLSREKKCSPHAHSHAYVDANLHNCLNISFNAVQYSLHSVSDGTRLNEYKHCATLLEYSFFPVNIVFGFFGLTHVFYSTFGLYL